MKIEVTGNADGAFRKLDKLIKSQLPFAQAYALTQTAKAAQREIEKEIPRVFDRPTQYTLRSVYTRPATKARLYAEVKLKDESAKGNPAVRWLFAEVRGGARTTKGFEKLLQRRGGLLPVGWYAVPTKYAPLDVYGNVPGSAINRILSQLQASRDPGTRETTELKRRRNSTKAKIKTRLSRYFAVVPGTLRARHLTPGIWERVAFGFGSSVRPLFIFTDRRPRYRPRLKFEKIVTQTVNAQFAMHHKRGLALALATAR